MKKYIILINFNTNILENNVVDGIRVGYICQGGVSFDISTNMYMQAMILSPVDKT